MEIAIVLILLVLVVVLFAMEVVSVDLIALMALMALVLTGILTPGEAFAGFSSPIIIILASIFVVSGALRETGVLDAAGALLLKLATRRPNSLLPMLMVSVGGFSAFMNNTTVTAMFTGPLMSVARRMGKSPSKLLMPLAHASILGGTCTLIGTSTNVAVSGYIEREGMDPIGLFEITPIGLIVLSIGVVYMFLFGNRLLPDYPDEGIAEGYKIRKYLTEIIVLPGSPLIGQKTFDSDLSILNFQILKVIRGDDEFVPLGREPIEEDDVLMVAGKAENLVKISKIEGIEIKAALDFSDPEVRPKNVKVAEVLITPQSVIEGRTLKEADFRRHYDLTVLAIYREGQALRDKIGGIILRTGDMLLVQGPAERFESLAVSSDLIVLEEFHPAVDHRRRGFAVLGFFAVAVMLAGLKIVPLSICLLGVAVFSVLTRCIALEKAYQVIDWRLLILIGGMTAFGRAMDNAGAAELVAKYIVLWFEPYGVMAILAGFFVLTVALTQPMSNAAAALVVLPIGLQTAFQLGLNERTFAIAIMLAASISLITPLEPSCVIVYGPGKYKFFDFLKVGIGLTLLLMVVVLFLIPVFWPLHP